MPLSLVPDEIEEYAVRHTTPLPPLLAELIAVTEAHTGSRAAMLTGPLEGMLLQTLAFAVRARRILELGTFTGFSALMLAAGLPDDGQLITCDVDVETTQIAREFWARSPDGPKIDLRLGPALETLRTLDGPFDLVFIDADKASYQAYYEATLPLLAPTGLMVIDNVLRRGRVVAPQDDNDRRTMAFNTHVQQDPRVQHVLLTIRDGIMLVRKKA